MSTISQIATGLGDNVRLIFYQKLLSILGTVCLLFTLILPLPTWWALQKYNQQLGLLEESKKSLTDAATMAQFLYARQYYSSLPEEFSQELQNLLLAASTLEDALEDKKKPEYMAEFHASLDRLVDELIENLETLEDLPKNLSNLTLIEQVYEVRTNPRPDNEHQIRMLDLTVLIDNLVFFSTEVLSQGSEVYSSLLYTLTAGRQVTLNSLFLPLATLVVGLACFGIRFLIHRILNHREAEDLALKQTELLERKVAERTEELKERNEELEHAHTILLEQEKLAALGNLVAGVAHEVNTPLGVAVTASSHLINHLDESDSKTVDTELLKETAALTFRNVRRAADLIRSFKQVSVEESSPDYRQFNLTEYLEESLLPSLAAMLKTRDQTISLISNMNAFITGSPGDVYQVVTNLVNNASIHGYGGRKGHIEIIVDEQDEEFTLCVKDQGHGMESDVLKRVFDPFFTTSRGSGGSGLGMMIVYNLVTVKMEGAVSLESTLGKGTIAELRIPKVINNYFK